MGRTIWEDVPASEITKGDVLQWGIDATDRVRVDWVYESETARDQQGRPALGIHVTGPTSRWEHNHGLRTGKLFVRDQPVKRMLPERAARVSDTNLRTLEK